MPTSKQRKVKGQGVLIPPSNVLDAIDKCLKEMCRTFPAKDLTPEEISNWHRDLSPFPIAAIEWSFDNWRRNGRFFPVYGDILDQCVAWDPPSPMTYQRIPADQYGKGYGISDMVWLFRKIQGKNMKRGESLSDAEYEALLTELDSKRAGGAPAWRRA